MLRACPIKRRQLYSSWHFSHLFRILLIFLLFTGGQTQEVSSVVNKAIRYASKEWKQEIVRKDFSSIYKVAKAWYDSKSNSERNDALELLHFLADGESHVLSIVKLGHHYASAKKARQALHYYKLAGELGPHHASLYNAGRMLAEQKDWVGALAYLKSAITLEQTHPKYAQVSTTKVAKEAFEIVMNQISREELTVVQAADVFLYGSSKDDDLPEPAAALWNDAVMALYKFNETFVKSSGKDQDENAMETAANSLRELWEKYSANLSHLQAFILLENINDMLGPLAGLKDKYVPMAGGYAEVLAMSPFCYAQVATSEEDPACFNGAASSAMSYYRRAADGEGAKRVLQMAQENPLAATHWKFMEQTPRVFHPGLEAKAWWDSDDFSAARSLTSAYQKHTLKILKELENVKALQEGRLRGTTSSGSPAQQVQIDAKGNAAQIVDNSGDGLQRIFTPYIGVRTEEDDAASSGAGGWAEFGPLFDGMNWDAKNCKVVPTICRALKNDRSLCTNTETKIVNSTMVWKACGADTVVTILRLRPGTTILPHCGTTNSRLILHFALEGADGIEFSVGGKVVKNYRGGDGHAIVFDDSFEHTVHHGGKQDRFVVLAVLAHPDLLI